MPDPPFQPVVRRSAARDRVAAEAQAGALVRAVPLLPRRYAAREKDGVRFIECDEAPRLRVIIDPGMGVSRTEASTLGRRVILLDGAGTFGPLIDNERQLYNLDHHAGCERLFTLSTCEQALLLVQGGLEISEGDWTVYANDPDLDTVLAIWCLLNHRRLRELRPEARDVLLPLLRLEGAIDANGPELARLCGLTTAVLEQTGKRIDDLVARERQLKQAGSWNEKDVFAYTMEMLHAVDSLVYQREDFGDYARVEEIYGHVEVAPRRVAVACRDGSGIYQVEQHLKSRWGDQLSLIALENQPGQYTLRRVRSVAGPELGAAYALLNKVDPAVDGRPPGKSWGGSGDIGGSPRPDGTRLTAEEVLDTVARAYRSPTWWGRTRTSLGALGVGVSFLLFWPLAGVLASTAPVHSFSPGMATAYQSLLASLLALGVGSLAIRVASRRRPWVFGWRGPANGGGWWLAPLVVLGAAPVAVWSWPLLGSRGLTLAATLLAGTSVLVAIEVWFRGLVHGLLVLDFPVQRPGGPWRWSRAASISAIAYALVITAILHEVALWAPGPIGITPLEAIVVLAGVAFFVGVGLAVLRERSLSLTPGLLIQVAAVPIWGALAYTLP